MTADAAPRAPRDRKAAARYHHGDLRAAAVRAATRVVATDGLDALSLRAVAAQLGVSAPALHHHFAAKPDLIAAAAGAAFTALDAALAEAEATAAGAPAHVLEELGVAYVRFAVTRPGEFRLVYGAHVRNLDLASYPEVARPGRATRRRVQRAVAAAFAGADLDARFAILWAQLVGIASLVVERELGPSRGVADAEALARTAIRSHLAGLRAA